MLGGDFEGVHEAEEAEMGEVADRQIESEVYEEGDFLVFDLG